MRRRPTAGGIWRLGLGALAAAMIPVMPAAAASGEAPAITGLEWLPREGPSAEPILNARLSFDAPAGLDSGSVRFGSVFHEILTDVELGAHGPGSHTVDLRFAPPGDKLRPYELNSLTLRGADGRTRTYGFCELVKLVETREKATTPRLSVDCLDGAGWVVYTIRVEEESPSATIWMRGVATRDNTKAAAGHVLQDATGAVARWGTALAVAYPQDRDGTQISAGGYNVVNEPSPDPSSQPGSRRVVIGIGGNVPPDVVAGAVYRWGAYYAVKPGHFDLPRISLEGSGLTVLGVETGASAGVAWGADLEPSIVLQRSDADLAVAADGTTSRSFDRTVTCMFGFLGDRIAGLASTGVVRIQGPSASVVGGLIVAGQPGAYRFDALAGVADSSGEFVLGWADMPLIPRTAPARSSFA